MEYQDEEKVTEHKKRVESKETTNVVVRELSHVRGAKEHTRI